MPLPNSIKRERQPTSAVSPCSRPLILRVVGWCLVTIWRAGVDWRTKRPFLSRFSAHLSIIGLTVLAVLLSGVGLATPRTADSNSTNVNAFSPNIISSQSQETATPRPRPTPLVNQPLAAADTISRQPIPHTTIPDRLRDQVVTYTVQAGDNIFDIAEKFNLSPETIVWSNREALQDAPWLIQLGLQLFIPPVDGVYHTVLAGETVESIAADYEVESSDLYNEWNGLVEGRPLREGQLIIVPNGRGEEVTWTPPQPQYAAAGSAQYSYGVCSGVTFTGLGGTGAFILPTGSPRVSGWYFRDVRNPGHIGIDYTCRTGDPIYASDNGVVTIAGWNGGYGILVEVNHGNSFVTRYGHFSEIIVGCGQSVYQGQLLGYCGSTGWSTGAHLHFEIRANGVPQNPQTYLP